MDPAKFLYVWQLPYINMDFGATELKKSIYYLYTFETIFIVDENQIV